MYDNGSFHPTTLPKSRAVEYHLDEEHHTASKVWEYHHDPDVFGSLMGNVQELANGNRLICWGSCDSVTITEIKPDGSTCFEMAFDPGVYTYRAYKFTDDDLKAMNLQSAVSGTLVPTFNLEQNYPNPVSRYSSISFSVSQPSVVDLTLYDALGRSIRTLFHGMVNSGSYVEQFDAGTLPSGSYLYTLSTASGSISKILQIVR